MADGLVNLQRELRRVEDDVVLPFRTLIGRMQGNRLLRDLRRVIQQLEFLDQLIASVLELSAERVGIGALLDLRTLERIARHSLRLT